MCKELSVSDSQPKHINLPDDKPQLFGRMLEFLYSGTVKTAQHPVLLTAEFEHLVGLIDLYIIATKYELDAYKKPIVQKLNRADSIPKNKPDFFKAASRAYQQIPVPDDLYREFFRSEAQKCFQQKEEAGSVDMIATTNALFLNSGGVFAQDMFKPCALPTSKQTGTLKSRGTKLPRTEH